MQKKENLGAKGKKEEPKAWETSLRKILIIIVLLNLGYFFVESSVAFRQSSVSLFADSIDFLEDAALNILVLIGLRMALASRAKLGMALSGLLLVPSALTVWTAVQKVLHPTTPNPASLGWVGLGALSVNLFCAFQLAKVRHYSGSLTRAAFLSARNDAIANVAIIAAGLVTLRFLSPWPDFAVGLGIMALNADAAAKVYRMAKSERTTI